MSRPQQETDALCPHALIFVWSHTLPALRFILLCSVVQDVPDELWELVELEKLNLSLNCLKILPPQLSLLSNLVVLNLWGNQVELWMGGWMILWMILLSVRLSDLPGSHLTSSHIFFCTDKAYFLNFSINCNYQRGQDMIGMSGLYDSFKPETRPSGSFLWISVKQKYRKWQKYTPTHTHTRSCCVSWIKVIIPTLIHQDPVSLLFTFPLLHSTFSSAEKQQLSSDGFYRWFCCTQLWHVVESRCKTCLINLPLLLNSLDCGFILSFYRLYNVATVSWLYLELFTVLPLLLVYVVFLLLCCFVSLLLLRCPVMVVVVCSWAVCQQRLDSSGDSEFYLPIGTCWLKFLRIWEPAHNWRYNCCSKLWQGGEHCCSYMLWLFVPLIGAKFSQQPAVIAAWFSVQSDQTEETQSQPQPHQSCPRLCLQHEGSGMFRGSVSESQAQEVTCTLCFIGWLFDASCSPESHRLCAGVSPSGL